ncbi:aminodeoxychorismate synthase component I [Methylocapsa palsarum]|uniref:aminodeoxychorismate synthase n=1 Tax=Methylocapsa palsarum TaxID=1612308 RepID=A0A1I3VTG0_9HYPH|nr:aminodeoxychorismate synthase component I [Methylocapsa palsarum]SFJ98704.1 para-aminobenzoate synthetase component 1 [Methylocapsa palsarum]
MHVIEIDFCDPAEAAQALRHLPFLTFLDSARADETLGRYSFVAADPFARLQGDETNDSWIARLKAALEAHRLPTVPGLPPFQGGAAGLFSYELGRSLERLPEPERNDLAFPDLSLGFYDVVVAFDCVQRRGWIMSSGLPETEPGLRSRRAAERGHFFESELRRAPGTFSAGNIAIDEWSSNFTKATYERAVGEVIERILAGDIFQANLSQRFEAQAPNDFDHFGFYKHLRKINPAPFGAYLDHESFVIASASPERFLKVEGDRVETRPIKGTRPRFADAVLDSLQAQALFESRKDRAENVMIVDLLRNDLSKVCVPGSVLTPQLCALESFATVHHLVSTVVGRLSEGRGAVDLLAAAFPGGSITGCPKVRAMEIITELERHARGPYCGAIGYLGFNGAMDTNIVIRTASFRGRTCVTQAGGGVVAGSDPRAEYLETLDKARRVFEAFGVKELAR